MQPVILIKSLAAASANNIALSQSTAAGNLLINGAAATGGVATLDTQRRVLFTFTADNSGRVFALYGTSQSGALQSEIIQGLASGTASSVLDYQTVTRIAATGAAAAITVGTSGVGSTPWQMPSFAITPFFLDIETSVSGTINYTIEYTMDDYWTPRGQASVPPISGNYPPVALPTAVAASTALNTLNLTNPVRGWRVTINSGTGTVAVEALQAGITNY